MYLPLGREWSKKLALILIAIGIILIPDALIPTFTDLIINVPLAMVMASNYSIPYIDSLVATYLMGFLLVFAGMMVYPYNTKRLILGRLKASVVILMKNPILLVIGIISLLVVYLIGQWAYDNLYIIARGAMGI